MEYFASFNKYMVLAAIFAVILGVHCDIKEDQIENNSAKYEKGNTSILTYIGYGFDVVYGNILGDAETVSDLGVRQCVIRYPKIQRNKFGVYTIHQGYNEIWVRKNERCWERRSRYSITNNDDYFQNFLNEFDTDDSTAIRFLNVKLKFGRTPQEIKGNGFCRVKVFNCSINEAGLVIPYRGGLSPDFVAAGMKLPVQLEDTSICSVDEYIENSSHDKCKNINEWVLFFKRYGTHFITHAITGGKIMQSRQEVSVDEKQFFDNKRRIHYANDTEVLDMNHSGKSQTQKTTVYGGYYTKGMQRLDWRTYKDWSKTLYSRPVPIKIKFRPLSMFLHGKLSAYEMALQFYHDVAMLSAAGIEYDTKIDMLLDKGKTIISHTGIARCPKDQLVLGGFALSNDPKVFLVNCEQGASECGNHSKSFFSIFTICAPDLHHGIRTVVSNQKHSQCPYNSVVAMGFWFKRTDGGQWLVDTVEPGVRSFSTNHKHEVASWLICTPIGMMNWNLSMHVATIDTPESTYVSCDDGSKILKGVQFLNSWRRSTHTFVLQECQSHISKCKFSVPENGGEGEYSFSLTTFNPSGKLVQIEYALNGVAKGAPTLGIKAANGVVIAAERCKTSSLVETETLYKIDKFANHIGVVAAGMPADFRVVLKKGRKEAIRYKSEYGDDIPGSQLVKSVASIMQEYTHSGGVRPFGISLLLASFDEEGPQLYQIDPSGAYFGWKATAIGSRMQNNNTFLEKRYKSNMDLEDAIHVAILTLKEGFEGELTADSIEIGVVGPDKVFKILPRETINDYLNEVL